MMSMVTTVSGGKHQNGTKVKKKEELLGNVFGAATETRTRQRLVDSGRCTFDISSPSKKQIPKVA